jgi:hypothetical protein
MIRRRAGLRFFSPQILSLSFVKPILICSAATPGSSTRSAIILSVSHRSTGGAQAPDASGFSASVASSNAA